MTAQQATEVPMVRIPRSAHPVPTEPKLRSRQVPIWTYALLVIAVLAGSILVARDLGWFVTTGRGVSLASGEGFGSGSGSGSGSGRVEMTAGAVPDDVKGWMSVQQVLDAFPVTQDALYERFAIPDGTPTDSSLSSLKEAGALDGFDIPALRDWLGEQVAQ